MDPHIAALTSFIIHYGYIVILPIAILEGPIITIISAFLAAQGYFNVAIVYIVVVIGDVLGDVLYYFVGWLGSQIVHTPIGKWLGVTSEKIASLEKHFDKHSGKTLLIGKWTHSLGFAVLMGAGVAKMPLGKFTWYNFLGTLPKSLVFVILGYYIGYAYQEINSVFDKAALIASVAVVTIIVFYYFKKRTTRTGA